MQRRKYRIYFSLQNYHTLYFNSCGLHLNGKGATQLAQNYKKFLSNIKFW